MNGRWGGARAGLVAAAGVALLGAGAVGYFIWRAPPATTATDSLAPSGVVPDIKALPSAGGRSVVSRLGSNTGPFMQIADRNDPSRISGELSADRSELLPDKRYLLVRPRAWNFLRDGRALLIEADKGRAYIPEESPDGRPEEALLEGNVVIRLFNKTASGERPDPDKDTAIYEARTDTLIFDGTLGQVTTPGELAIDGVDGSFRGRGLTLLLNEVSERIEYLKIDVTDYIEVMPKGGDDGGERLAVGVGVPAAAAVAGAVPGGPSAAASSPATLTPAPTAPTAPGRSTHYLATCAGDVAIVQGSRFIRGDSLSAWVRSTQSGKKSKPAASPPIGRASMWVPIAMMQPEMVPNAAPVVDAAPLDGLDGRPAAADADLDAHPPSDPDSDKPVRLTFDGPLELRPLSAAPVELSINDSFVRITSAEEGGVSASDGNTGASVTAKLAEYGVTRRDVGFGSAEPMGVLLTAPGSGTAAAQRIELSLLNGRAHVTGAGSLADEGGGAGLSERSVTWSESADFVFAVEDGRMTSRLAEAFLSGTVRAADSESEFNAARVQAVFEPVGDKARLARLFLAGRAWGSDGQGGQLSANTIDVRFAPQDLGSASSIPVGIMARGNVVAAETESALWASGLDVSLDRIDGAVAATRVFASGPVFFQNADGVSARADSLVAWPIAERIELSGEGAAISKATSLIAGPIICMDGIGRTLNLPGAGVFVHETTEGATRTESSAQWDGTMNFDDATGMLVCEGATRVISSTHIGAVETKRDTMDSSRLEIALSEGGTSVGDGQSLLPESGDRRVALVRATGGISGPAKIESRTYSAESNGRTLRQLLYLESGMIEADNNAGELRVPGGGKLLAVDRRDRDTAQAPAGAASGRPAGGLSDSMTDARGNSLFSWTDSMTLHRASGLARMLGGVKLVHDRQDGGERVLLECRSLEASLAIDDSARDTSGSSWPGGSGRLTRAVATDRVWMRFGGRELTGRVLSYDATTDIVTANGDGGANPVSMLDLSKGTPFSAQSILWNLSTNRFEARRLSPIVMPR